MRIVKFVSILALMFLSELSWANRFPLQPSADATIYEHSPETAHGQASTLAVYSEPRVARTLFNFDLSRFWLLQPEHLKSARLVINNLVSGEQHWNLRLLSLHNLNSAWDEDSVTWYCNDAQCSHAWQGGDYEYRESDKKKLAHKHKRDLSFDVTRDLKQAIELKAFNGWLLKDKYEWSPFRKHHTFEFSSREAGSDVSLVLELTSDAPDLISPEIKIVEPQGQFYIGDNGLIAKVAIQDNAPLHPDQFVLMLDDVDISSACSFKAGYATCTIDSIDEGIHELQSGYIDSAGHSSIDLLDFYYMDRHSDTRMGLSWLTGEGEPNDLLGRVQDLYLNRLTGDVYQKESLGWQYIANLKGPQGKQGLQGEKGEQGPQGEKGDKGETGPRGDKGEQGIPGPVGPAGDSFIASLNCSVNQTIRFDGQHWQCHNPPSNPFANMGCAEGDTLVMTQGQWTCQPYVAKNEGSSEGQDGSGDGSGDNNDNGDGHTGEPGTSALLRLTTPLDQLAITASNTYNLDHPASAFDGVGYEDQPGQAPSYGTGLGLIGNKVKRGLWINGWNCSAPIEDQWIDVHFDKPVQLNRADIFTRTGFARYSVKDIAVQISTDHGERYTTHDQLFDQYAERTEFNFATPTPEITNVRFRFNGNPNSRCVIEIDEIVLYGQELL